MGISFEKVNRFDLRLGNIIGNKDGKPFVVNEDTLARFEQCEKLLGKFRPIYMNNNWARKFGFDDLRDMCLDYRLESKFPIEFEKEDLKRLKVYEAQNLYRALTVKELKI